MFKPEVTVFDGHAVLGRSLDESMDIKTPVELLEIMDRTGIERALVYHRNAVMYNTLVGNDEMMALVDGHARLTPQHIFNMSIDPLDKISQNDTITSVRVFPKSHHYPITLPVVGKWLVWLQKAGIALWISAEEIEVRDLYQMAKSYPDINLVLSNMDYNHFASIWSLLPRIPNLHMELSRQETLNGVQMMVERAGARRLIFGSYFPDFDPAAYLSYLHQCRLPDDELQSICHGNLTRLLTLAQRSV
jgi:uncharacterized protein